MSYVQRRRFLWILFFVGLALAAVVANATTLARLSFEDLAQRSAAIARGRCLGSSSYWDGGEIWTETKFEVVELQKGPLKPVFTVRMLGGRAGSYYSRVDGVPTFRLGEEAYLFLWGAPGQPYRVLGWSQGTFRIARDRGNGGERVSQESSGRFDVKTKTFRSDEIRGTGVSEFRRRIQLAIGQGVPASR